MKEKNVYVESEFAPLRRVVLTQSQFAFPKNMKDSNFLVEENLKDFRENEGKDFADAFPNEQLKWEKERENPKKVLEKYNIEICRPRLLTDYEKEVGGNDGYSNFFARDPFFTIGNIIIEGSLRFPHRRN